LLNTVWTVLAWVLLTAYFRPLIEIILLILGEWWFQTRFEEDRSKFNNYIIQITTAGAICGVMAAFSSAGTVIQTRRLVDTETTLSIVFYFSMYCALAGLATLPFGWIWPTPFQLLILIASGVLGGLAHIFLTSSYHHAPASLVAPLDYTTMIWAYVLGYVLFSELPTVTVYIGSAIVAGAGLFVIWRERQLGLRRRRLRDMQRP